MILSYLARLGDTWLKSRDAGFVGPLDEVRLPLRAWPTDLDTFGHVNNGRYLTLMDFGRYAHIIRTGLFEVMLRNRWRPVIGAASMQYRREIRAFQRFDLVTRLLFWDQKWFYIEQRFERDDTLLARGIVRGLIKEGRRTVPPPELLAARGHQMEPPEPDAALLRWIESQS